MKNKLIFVSIWLLLIPAVYAESKPNNHTRELMQLSLEELMNIQVISGSRHLEKLSETTSTMHIITSENIENSGFNYLKDILRFIPGIQTAVSTYGENRITFRGISSTYSEKIIIMLDSHILNDVRSGSATYQFLDSIPLSMVERIEIMKGPGSSMYGANAFLGLINIITKNTDDDFVHTGLHTSFNSNKRLSSNAFITLNTTLKNSWKLFTSLNTEDNNGYNPIIEQNGLWTKDEANLNIRLSHLYVKLENDTINFKLRLGERQAGDGFGILHVPNDASRQKVLFGFSEINSKFEMKNDTVVTVKAYTDLQSSDNVYIGLGAGQIPEWHPLYPWNRTGYMGNSLAEERVYGAEIRLTKIHNNHKWTAALSHRFEELVNPELYANFNPYPLDSIQNVSEYWNWIDPAERHISSLYLQDIWELNQKTTLTLDCRLDRFSDFNTDFNPRLGLKYNIGENHKLTAIAGTSFRAPDFLSMYVKNNPVSIGNPNLKPEDIKSYELGLSGTFRNKTLFYRINTFYNCMDNLIGIGDNMMYMNLNTMTAKGAEVTFMASFPDTASLKFHISLVDSSYKDGSPVPDYPKVSSGLIGEWFLSNKTTLFSSIYWQSQTQRQSEDSRPEIKPYSLFTFTLKHEITSSLSGSLSLQNAFNKLFYYPAPFDTIPGDYPGEGRQLHVHITYRF